MAPSSAATSGEVRGGPAPGARHYPEPDRDPPDVPADRAAGVHVVRAPHSRLRVDAAALEAAYAGEHVATGGRGGSLHIDEDPRRGENSRRPSRRTRPLHV